MKYYLAIDIGASSGRHIVGWKDGEEMKTDEVFRFPNSVSEKNEHLIWDMDTLVSNVKEGIAKAKGKYPGIESLSIDTWGVDYVLMRGDSEVFPVYAYRDNRTEDIIPEVHGMIPFAELYRKTGCQFQPFNTLYQLFADKMAGRLEGVTDFLMIPEYLLYKLCGVKAKEFTNATTTGMVNAETLKFDAQIISRLSLPEHLFPELHRPGEAIGEYDGIKVILCATHDTASAVEGIPMEGNHPYISSGTWSLLGIKTMMPITDEGSEKSNFSNEGGVGYNRYQKNVMGLWLVNELKRELCPEKSFPEITYEAEQSCFEGTVDANNSAFLAPKSMKAAFDAVLGLRLTEADYFRCAYRSLALSYKNALDEMEANTGMRCDQLTIVGGGAKNKFLNKLTEQTTGKTIIALPVEATALGNLKIQMEANR